MRPSARRRCSASIGTRSLDRCDATHRYPNDQLLRLDLCVIEGHRKLMHVRAPCTILIPPRHTEHYNFSLKPGEFSSRMSDKRTEAEQLLKSIQSEIARHGAHSP